VVDAPEPQVPDLSSGFLPDLAADRRARSLAGLCTAARRHPAGRPRVLGPHPHEQNPPPIVGDARRHAEAKPAAHAPRDPSIGARGHSPRPNDPSRARRPPELGDDPWVASGGRKCPATRARRLVLRCRPSGSKPGPSQRGHPPLFGACATRTDKDPRCFRGSWCAIGLRSGEDGPPSSATAARATAPCPILSNARRTIARRRRPGPFALDGLYRPGRATPFVEFRALALFGSGRR
jgi:hypothetical protein